MHAFLEMFAPDFVLRNALWASLLLGAIAPLIGVHLVLERRVLLALALPEAGNLGVALSVWVLAALGVNAGSENNATLVFGVSVAGALLLMLLALAGLRLVRRAKSTHVHAEDAGVHADGEEGALFALALASTLILAASHKIPELGLLDALKGELLAVSTPLLLGLVLGAALVVSSNVLLKGPFQAVLYDPLAAHASGLPAARIQSLSTGLLCLTVALGSLAAGPLAVFAFLVAPATTLLPFVKHFGTLCWTASAVGVACALAGFYLSYCSDTLPAAAAQMLCLGAVWLGSRVWLCVRKNG